MNTEILGIVLMYGLVIALAIPFGKYLGMVLGNEKTWLDPIFQPIENFIYKISGIQSNVEMNWKQNLVSLLSINGVWLILSMLVLTNMSWLPLNPDENPSMSIHLAFNTANSFVCNTNLQHYSGESGLSYLGQLILMLWQFLSAATGLAIAAVVIVAMKEKTANHIGNFNVLLVKSSLRILLPLSILIASILVFNGTPMTFKGKTEMLSLQGDTMQISTGPVAAFVAIKHLGTNGGGFFGANSAHPFENPNYLTNITQMASQMLLPIALIFAMGYMLRRRKLAWMVFGVMSLGFILLALPTVFSEMNGNSILDKMGIEQNLGNMEGKEIRFGAAASGFWSIATTVISTGSVNAMHDSFNPLSGLNQLLAMMINAFYGGVGVGLLNFYVFIILAVFISGLMVGRTPEFLGKKIEAKEMQIAMLVALLHPFLILVGTAISANDASIALNAINNPGFHGFSEMLYEFTSASANNGSGFEGLSDNTPFWNIATGLVMLMGRFLPIAGQVAIAGMLASKKHIPESNGTLKTDTATFGFMVFAVIAIVAALSFFPALTLGPIAEYFTISSSL